MIRNRYERVLQEAPSAPMPYHVHTPDAVDVRPEIRDDAPPCAITLKREAQHGIIARLAKKKGPLA